MSLLYQKLTDLGLIKVISNAEVCPLGHNFYKVSKWNIESKEIECRNYYYL